MKCQILFSEKNNTKKTVFCLLGKNKKNISKCCMLNFSQSAKHQFSTDAISYFLQPTELDISCKLSLLETICMKCQILFSEKKNIKKYHQYVVC